MRTPWLRGGLDEEGMSRALGTKLQHCRAWLRRLLKCQGFCSFVAIFERMQILISRNDLPFWVVWLGVYGHSYIPESDGGSLGSDCHHHPLPGSRSSEGSRESWATAGGLGGTWMLPRPGLAVAGTFGISEHVCNSAPVPFHLAPVWPKPDRL